MVKQQTPGLRDKSPKGTGLGSHPSCTLTHGEPESPLGASLFLSMNFLPVLRKHHMPFNSVLVKWHVCVRSRWSVRHPCAKPPTGIPREDTRQSEMTTSTHEEAFHHKVLKESKMGKTLAPILPSGDAQAVMPLSPLFPLPGMVPVLSS